MTPSEMTNEQLADALMKSEIAVFGARASMLLVEATSRLRNSIPKPTLDVIELQDLSGKKWYYTTLSKYPVGECTQNRKDAETEGWVIANHFNLTPEFAKEKRL